MPARYALQAVTTCATRCTRVMQASFTALAQDLQDMHRPCQHGSEQSACQPRTRPREQTRSRPASACVASPRRPSWLGGWRGRQVEGRGVELSAHWQECAQEGGCKGIAGAREGEGRAARRDQVARAARALPHPPTAPASDYHLTPSKCAGWYRSQVLREKVKAGRVARDG